MESFAMRTTIELPDDLLRRAKAEAALRGIKFKDLVQESLQRLLESTSSTDTAANEMELPTVYDLMKDYCGIVDSGISDLATNPAYMEGFGRDSLGHR
jgi:hypothetical protein